MRTSTFLLALGGSTIVNCLASRSGASSWTVGQTVKISGASVSGHAAPIASDVSEYLGIPFAQPPVGSLRFQSPQPYSGSSTINGTAFGYSCPAVAASLSGPPADIVAANITAQAIPILANIAGIGAIFDEDCLTLNVWTKPQTGDAKKAVLIWIYGGGFTTGTTNTTAYNGQFIADQEDVILVSINYRLNIFGFSGDPSSTQNLGLLDQRLAVEWVRDNIANFGGDPNRITLFGQSAGGASVDYYTYAWANDPIAAGFIPESGTAGAFSNVSAAQGAAMWYNVTQTLGCGNAAANSSCIASKNFTQILAALPPTGNGGIGFGPVVDNTVVFPDYNALGAEGKFAQLPMLLGNNDFEAGLFELESDIQGKFLPASYWLKFDDVAFACPAANRANISVANGLPVWRYRYFGAFPNTQLTTVPYSGAWHAAEIPLLFDTLPTGEGVPATTPEEAAIATYLRGAWAAFAKNPTSGLSTYGGGWPMYVPGQNTLVRLAYNNQTGTNLAINTPYDAGCASTFPLNATVLGKAGSNSTGVGGANATATGSGNTPPPKETGAASRMVGSLGMVVVAAVCVGLL